MEILAVVAGLCILAALAARWGYDSRESLPSKEQQLADLGLTWDLLASSPVPMERRHAGFDLDLAATRLAEDQRTAEMARLARQAAGRGHSLRGHLARLFTELANWLDPETARTDGASRPVGLLGGRPAGRPHWLG
jgi:hypothetical protein